MTRSCPSLLATLLMVFIIPVVGCDEETPAEPTWTPPKTSWVVLLLPDSVPEGSRIFRGDEQVATVFEAEQSRLFQLRDPLKPERKIERNDPVAEFELGQEERIHGVEWTLRQPTPCGDHIVALAADGPSSKEQEQEARDAVKPVEDPRRVINERAIFVQLSFDTRAGKAPKLMEPTSVFYLPPPEDIASDGTLTKDTAVEIGSLKLHWSAKRTVVGKPRGDTVFDLHCKARLPVLVNGEEVGRTPGGRRSNPPRSVFINRHSDCLKLRAVERVLESDNRDGRSLTSKADFFSREKSPVFGFRWRGVEKMLEGGTASRLGVSREVEAVTAERCR